MVPDLPVAAGYPYDEWGRLTQFLKSARLAFARERELWASLGVNDKVRIAAPDGKFALHWHLDAIDNGAELLHGTVLLRSYALVESAAADRLATEQRKLGKIEDWGGKLLSANDRKWTDVAGGRPGAVEVAVVRNAIAHGSRTIDEAGHERLRAAGSRERPVGSVVTLTYDELYRLRERLRSLLNVSGIGH